MAAPVNASQTIVTGSVAILSLPAPATGTVQLELAKNLFRGPMRAVQPGVPARAVFVNNVGGVAPSRELGTGQAIFRQRVQIMVRGAPDGFTNDEGLARALLEKWRLTGAGDPDHVSVNPQESEPNYLGQDEQGCHLWSINLEVVTKA